VTEQDAGDRDAALVARLLAGDEAAFTGIVSAWSPGLLHVARGYVGSHASAEEVVQETWLAVIRGLAGFEGRSSLRTWVFRIVVNVARKRGVKDARVLPIGDLLSDERGPTVDAVRFRPVGDQWAGHWADGAAPTAWGPERSLLDGEIRDLLARALAELPERQRMVVALRDVHGLTAEEVAESLGVSAGNQRVLLHRGRARLRLILEDYYRDTTGPLPTTEQVNQ
jgi:RNA polymerase sigma-70 factor (ECF subfamily)